MRQTRFLSALVLRIAISLALMLGAGSGAWARGLAPVAGTSVLTICSGATVSRLRVDADGNPVQPQRHNCHDCCLVLFGLSRGAQASLAPQRLVFRLSLPLKDVTGASVCDVRAVARGPPVFV